MQTKVFPHFENSFLCSVHTRLVCERVNARFWVSEKVLVRRDFSAVDLTRGLKTSEARYGKLKIEVVSIDATAQVTDMYC